MNSIKWHSSATHNGRQSWVKHFEERFNRNMYVFHLNEPNEMYAMMAGNVSESPRLVWFSYTYAIYTPKCMQLKKCTYVGSEKYLCFITLRFIIEAKKRQL